MTDNTNTKKEIIAEIFKIAAYCKEHHLYNFTRKESSLEQDSKANILELRDRMLAVVIRGLVQRGINGELPELMDLYEERERTHDAFIEDLESHRVPKFNKIETILHQWLGENLGVRVSDSTITITVPGTGKNTMGLDISMYYRERKRYSDEKPEHGTIEINQPTFGSWDPKHPDNGDIRQFFSVLSKICDESNWIYLDKIRDLLDEVNEFISTRYKENNKALEEIENRATKIVRDTVIPTILQ